MMRFDRFTERAQEAAQRAAEIIQRYGHNQIDTEHILLALIEQPDGVITQILKILNVEPEPLVDRIDAALRSTPKANMFGGGGIGCFPNGVDKGLYTLDALRNASIHKRLPILAGRIKKNFAAG